MRCDYCRWRCAPQLRTDACHHYWDAISLRPTEDTYYDALRHAPAWALECVLLNHCDEIEELYRAAYDVQYSVSVRPLNPSAAEIRERRLQDAIGRLDALFGGDVDEA